MGLCLDVTAAKQSLPGGETTSLNAFVQGGISGYDYEWTALDPSGDDASGDLSDVAVANPTFTPSTESGTYQVTCTVTDAANETITQTILIYVGIPLTLDLRYAGG